MHWLERTELLLGEEKLAKLKNANVLVVGLGGVGAYAAEQLCRAGIGKMTIVDGDVVEDSNRNRQLPALISTKGQPKAEILEKRFMDINPELELTIVNEYIRDQQTIDLLNSAPFDYVVDAIDTLSPKVFLVYHALQLKLRVISSMGAGGKMDPSKIEITDIKKSYNCKLAKMMRKRLGRLGVKKGVKVVFSSEEIDETAVRIEEGRNKKSTVGTISYMPPLFGGFIASAVIRDLIAE
ncbi:tRNA threonylcarbamoyladenosine dehydratase [uncultured Draconibacterium sp.]|uniref:tRNA threonylcarbamoyladenosine dehydratase n=1 Tax=uncultured Draconibacterium sp. TaxID=1573823 RepID=UPI0025F37926|nr:tRNA threonylcarbamoyladenosine dehydratase [uncultured Draconibacterium sp.]